MEISNETLARLRSEHGDELHQLNASEISNVARPPTKAEYRRFRTKTADERTRPDALEELTLSCLLHPSRAEFEKILQRKPALGIAGAFFAKSGARWWIVRARANDVSTRHADLNTFLREHGLNARHCWFR